MRFKDFGTVEQTILSTDLVSVSSSIASESEEMRRLELANKSYLDPWRIPISMDASKAKFFTVRYEQEIVGQIVLFNFQFDRGVKSCSISYWISKEHTNKDIGTTSVELVIEYAFTHLDVHEVDAMVQPENLASIRVIEKLKYQHRDMIAEGKLIDGRWQNYTLYTVTKKVKDANV